MIDLRVFPWSEQRAVIAHVLERIEKLEAELAEIRQQSITYVTYNYESQTDLEALRRQISETVDRNTR